MSKEKSIVLLTHLGLGDQIICNGIVVNLLKLEAYDEVVLLAKSDTLLSVERMYRGLNVRCVSGNSDDDILRTAEELWREGYKFLKIGGFGEDFMVDDASFAESFYDQAGLSFDESFDSFHLERSKEEEQDLYEVYSPPADYVFLHEDPQRTLNILPLKPSLHDRFNLKAPLVGRTDVFTGAADGTRVIQPDPFLERPISDYCKLIQKAKEVHCIDSSFALFVDRLPNVPRQKLFIHRYVRWGPKDGNQMGAPTVYRKAWEFLT
jgi:hypothetical protein